MTDELAVVPATGEIASEIDKALLEKNRAIDEADNADPPPAKEPPKEQEDPVQKRIDKLTREKYDARRKADLAEYRTKELEARLAALEAKPAQAAPAEPTLEGFGYDEVKYQAAMREWIRSEASSVAREEAKKALTSSQAERIQTKFDERQTEFAKSNPDYIEKVLERDTLPISEAIQDALLQMDTGPAIAYYLCTHEDKAREIMSLPPMLQAREIGRIEASLEKKPAPVVSKAPPPPPKIDAGQPAAELSIEDSSSWSDKQFLKWRRSNMK